MASWSELEVILLLRWIKKRSHSFAPEGGRHPRLIEHGDDTFFNHSIGPFCYTILLRPVSDSVLPLNAMINAECFELSWHIFPTLIIMQRSHPFASEIFSPGLELLDSTKFVWLMFQKINSLKVRDVINKWHPASIAMMSGDLYRAMHIAVNKLEGVGNNRSRRRRRTFPTLLVHGFENRISGMWDRSVIWYLRWWTRNHRISRGHVRLRWLSILREQWQFMHQALQAAK